MTTKNKFRRLQLCNSNNDRVKRLIVMLHNLTICEYLFCWHFIHKFSCKHPFTKKENVQYQKTRDKRYASKNIEYT